MSSNDIKKLKPTKVTLLFKQYAQKLSFQCAINMKVMNEICFILYSHYIFEICCVF